MGLSILVPDASFSQVVSSLTLPDRTGLVGEFVLGGTQAESITNRAAPSLADMTVVGSPTYGVGFAKVRSGGAYGSIGFDTGLTTPENPTLIVLVRKDTLFPVALGSAGFNGFVNYNNQPSLYNSMSGTLSNVPQVSVPGHTDFAFFAGLLPKGAPGQIYTYASGALTTNTGETNGGASRGTETLKIGTTLENVGIGIADVAYAAVFERLLSADDIDDAYLSLKAFMATRGVTVS